MRLAQRQGGGGGVRARSTSSTASPCFPTLAAATADLHHTLATTGRPREFAKPVLSAEAAAANARGSLAEGRRVGIVFGPERTGLTNDELLLADALVSYPVNPDFASLNLAQAVLLFGYAWFRQTTGDAPVPIAAQTGAAATKADLGGLVDHLVRELDAVELLSRRGAPGQPDPHHHGDAGAPPMDRRGAPSDARHHQGSGGRA